MTTQNPDTAAEAASERSFTIRTFVLFAVVTVWALLTGYYRKFSIFGGWDDEGYLMMTVKQFLDGDVLYAQIWTLYGPAYYVYKWVVHGLFGLPITHDVTELTTLTMWILIALLGGLFVCRLTRSALGGAAAYALIFLTLFMTAYVAAHPQELYGVLIVLIFLLLPGDSGKRGFNFRLAAVGALMAGVILTKVNIGVFDAAAVAITFVAFTAASRGQRLALIGLTLTAAAMPFILFRKQLAMHWFEFGVLVAAALIGILLVNLNKNNRPVFFVKGYAIVTLSFFAAATLMFLFTMSKNVAPAVLLDGLVFTPLKFSDSASTTEVLFYRVTIGWAVAAVCAAAAIIFYGKRKPFETEIAVLLLQALFGLGTVFALLIGYYNIGLRAVEKIGGVSPLTKWVFLNESVGHYVILNFATPFLWLLIIEQIRRQEFSPDMVPRTALALVAVLQTLQIYPLPGGAHVSMATFPIVIGAVVCLCDAFKGFKTLFPRPFGLSARFYTGLAAAAALILILAGTYRTYRSREFYDSRFSLNLPGATRMRLSEEETAGYNFITRNAQFNCDSFVSMPGLMSFNFWAKKETPTTFNVTEWMRLLDDGQQQAIVEKLKTSESGCAVYSPTWADFWVQWLERGQSLESFPLSAYILSDYTTVGTVNDYRFMRRSGSTEPLVYAARTLPAEQNAIEFVLPPNFDFQITRIELFNLSARRTIADSRTNRITVTNEQSKLIGFPLPFDADSTAVQKYKLQWSNLNPADIPEPKSLILRFYDKDENLIAHIPFPVN